MKTSPLSLHTSLQPMIAPDPVGSAVFTALDNAGLFNLPNGDEVLQQLLAPGMTRAQQLTLLKKSLIEKNFDSLGQSLSTGNAPADASAKNFLQALMGVEPLKGGPRLDIEPAAGMATLTGDVAPNEQLDVVNFSIEAGSKHNTDQIIESTTSDAQGHVAMPLGSLREGDVLGVRVHADPSGWQVIHATGIGDKDTRGTPLAMYTVGLKDLGNGTVSLFNSHRAHTTAEPGVQLRFTNLRTKQETTVTIDDNGEFAAGTTLPGRADDVFSIAMSDGVYNTDFKDEWGQLTVPGGPATADLIPDPIPEDDATNDDGEFRPTRKPFTQPLFEVGGPKVEDVEQGWIGDCYFAAGTSAVAFARPDLISKAITTNDGGKTFTVTFKTQNAQGQWVDTPVTVDNDIWVTGRGAPYYGHSDMVDGGYVIRKLWFPIVEKAWAALHKGYDVIDKGGPPGAAISAWLGTNYRYQDVAGQPTDKTWATIVNAVDHHQPIVAGTHPHSDPISYAGTGIISDHAYTVIGYKVENGQRYVHLRNPWGSTEPKSDDPKEVDDGEFFIKAEDLTKLFSFLQFI